MLDVTKLSIPKKKAAILITATDLFQQFGIKRVSVEEICQRAVASKMTFYKYFKNKHDLVRFIWEKGFEQAFEKFDEIREKKIPFEQKLHLMLKLKEETTAKFSHQFALDYLYAVPELKSFFEQLSRNSMKHLLEFIKESQKKGEVRSDILPEFFLAMINNLTLLAKDETLINKYQTYKDFVMEVNKFVFYGILPRPDSK